MYIIALNGAWGDRAIFFIELWNDEAMMIDFSMMSLISLLTSSQGKRASCWGTSKDITGAHQMTSLGGSLETHTGGLHRNRHSERSYIVLSLVLGNYHLDRLVLHLNLNLAQNISKHKTPHGCRCKCIICSPFVDVPYM